MTADEWAMASLAGARLASEIAENEPVPHPAVLLQQATRQAYTFDFPAEHHSADTPWHARRNADDELLIPIDQVLGKYDDRERHITVYKHNVETAAQTLKCEPAALLYVVRLHEYGHALDHLGQGLPELDQGLGQVSVGRQPSRLPQRTRRFRTADEREKEFWAQAFTWVALQSLPSPGELSSAYLELMKRQRPEYQIDWDILTLLTQNRLRYLRTLWMAPPLRRPPRGLSVREAIEALVTKHGAEDLKHIGEIRGSLAALSRLISLPTFASGPASGTATPLQLLIARSGPLQVRIYAEATKHARPHFHLYHKAGHAASYAIDDGRRLAGSMPSKYEKLVTEWAAAYRDHLARAWHDVNNGIAPMPLVLVA